MVKHGSTHVQVHQSHARHHLPSQRQSASAMKQRDAQDVEGPPINGASSEDAIHVRAAPGGQHLRDPWVLHRMHSNAFMQQPPSKLGTTPGCLSVAWNMVCHLAHLNRLGVDEPNNTPRPIRNMSAALCWMHSAKLREERCVSIGTAAHANDLS